MKEKQKDLWVFRVSPHSIVSQVTPIVLKTHMM